MRVLLFKAHQKADQKRDSFKITDFVLHWNLITNEQLFLSYTACLLRQHLAFSNSEMQLKRIVSLSKSYYITADLTIKAWTWVPQKYRSVLKT